MHTLKPSVTRVVESRPKVVTLATAYVAAAFFRRFIQMPPRRRGVVTPFFAAALFVSHSVISYAKD